jgi:hypothetical protein
MLTAGRGETEMAERRRQRVAVTMRALTQRLNRRLKAQDEMLASPRGRRSRFDLGDYFIVDARNGFIIEKKISPKRLEEIAREHGALKEWEEVIHE